MVLSGALARIIMNLMVLSTFLLVICAAVPSVLAASALENIQVREDTVERIDPDTGERIWQVVHPSVWKNTDRLEQEIRITDPVLLDGTLYYGVHSWLIQLNMTTGVIENRLWFPARIAGVETTDGGLSVSVEVYDEFKAGQQHRVAYLYRPGTRSPEEIWEAAGTYGPWKDVTYMAPGLFNPDYKFTPEELETNLAMLGERRAQEPGNPFYEFLIGWLHTQAGYEVQAQAAFERAVSTRAVHWTTWLQLTTLFDRIGAYDLADQAFEKTQDLMAQLDWIDVHSWSSSVIRVVLMRWSIVAVEEAIQAERLEDADRILERVAWVFPYTENGPAAWERLARWYRSHQRNDLAEKWHGHAKVAAESPWHTMTEVSRQADLAYALVVSLAFASLLSVLVIGIRRASDSQKWGKIAYPGKAETLAVIVCCLLSFVFLYAQRVSVNKVGHIARMSLEVGQDGWSSPNSRLWLEQLEDSDARSELLQHIESAEQARENGAHEQGESLKSEVSARLVLSAMKADARAKAWQGMEESVSMPMLKMVIWMAWLVGLYWLGNFLGRRFSRLGNVVRYGVPGGARSAGILTPFILAATVFVVSSFAIDLDTILVQLATPDIGRYFGLGALGSAEVSAEIPYRLTTWTVLGVVVVLHGATVWWSGRRT